ncbi:class V lanthionine synthetase subunit LxmK [Modestobacter italicus]|uniref:class V lanthionine synthetase subunit LxmK n=1 Tax=Modestobacter italicus (strain DSM 44449 / CECT 9708 / BC 501) TaxID=2732864 RepID=UPI001C9592B9|nr:class V lanthionine synthetase subunit LxmK [Modestobacter italicus]
MRIDPRIDDFLEAHGLGRVRPETTKEQNGRNANFLVVTTTGRPLFVKRIRMGSTDAAERFSACVAFETLRQDDPAIRAALGTAPLVATDAERGFLAYEAVTGAASLAEIAREHSRDGGARDQAVAHHAPALGRIMAAVHALDVDRVPEREAQPHMPPVAFLDALPWQLYANASAPVLQVWHRLQRDPAVTEALHTLRAEEAAAAPTAIHGDVRLDQFLVGRDDVLRLIDVEEFRRGDVARDLGAMVGEWLHRATLDIVADHVPTPAGAAVADLELSHEDVLAAGAAALDRRRPVITAFWDSYRAAGGGSDDPGFVDRVTRFAGWHLFDRLIAVAEYTSRISAVHWAAAGIGRQALLHPRAAAPALGLPALAPTAQLEELAA